MGTVIKDAKISVDSFDFSPFTTNISTNLTREMVDDSHFGDNTKASIPGLKSVEFSFDCDVTYGSGSTEEKLDALYNNESVVTVQFRFDKTAAISAANPEYTFSGYLEGYSPLSAAHGAKATTPVKMVLGSGDIARATS